jgi:hypothetical protein
MTRRRHPQRIDPDGPKHSCEASVHPELILPTNEADSTADADPPENRDPPDGRDPYTL